MSLNITESIAVQAVAEHLLGSDIGDDQTVAAMRALTPLIAAANRTLHAGLTATDWAEAVRLWDRT